MPIPERFSKRTRTSIASDAWSTLCVIFAVAAAFVLNRTFDLGNASWAVGVGIFLVLIYLRVRVEHRSRMRQLHEYLQSLPPGQRLDALDKYYNGALSSVTQTPEYRDMERIVRGRMERSTGPILKRLDRLAQSQSTTAHPQIEEQLKKLRQALDDVQAQAPPSDKSNRR